MKTGVGDSVLVEGLEGEFSVSDCVRKLKSRMKVGYEVNIVFQFHATTTCDSDDVIDVPFV